MTTSFRRPTPPSTHHNRTRPLSQFDFWKRVIVAVIFGFCLLSIVDQSTFLSGVLTSLKGYFDSEQKMLPSVRSMSALGQEQVASKTFVVTTTYYPDISDIRFNLALELCKLAHLYKIHLIVVDDSPEHETVREQFQNAGTSEYIHTFQQDKNNYSGKGGALRQAIQQATTLIQEKNSERGNGLNDAVICFTEPEKVDLMNHMHLIARPIVDGVTDVVIPTRNDELFRLTYPIEQYHSESFGNLHFDLLAKQFAGFQKKSDWLFGPFAFKATLASSWLSYDGNSWDAQMIPYVRGVRHHNWRIMSVPVNFRHPKVMKEQEEGYSAWTKKRLKQLNLLFELLGDKELTPSDV